MAFGEKILEFLTGGTVAKVLDVIKARVPDVNQAAQLAADVQRVIQSDAFELQKLAMQNDATLAQSQLDVDKVEAGADSLFKSGWRPAVGWVCVAALAYQMVGRPLLAWASAGLAWMPPPSLELDTLMTLLAGLLGLGSFRTYEKIKGVS